MAVKKKIEKKYLVALLICVLLFVASLFVVFFWQQEKLNSQFDTLIADNLAAYTHGQRRQANGVIIDVENTLSGMAAVIEDTDLLPDGDWLNIYIQEISDQSDMFKFDYIPAENIENRLASETAPEESKAVCSRLLAGEDVVTQVHQSAALDGRWVLSVATPVKKDGVIIGALRARLDVAMLFLQLQESSLFEKSISLLVTQDGDIVYADSDAYQTSGNLYESMELNGVKQETAEELQKKIQKEDRVTYHFISNGKTYYAAADRLDYNDWYIVKFVRSRDVIDTSEYILKSVVVTGILLVALTAIMISIAAVLILQQKKRLNLEAQRYSLLAQFSDTILFEFDCFEDTLRFTNNAKKVLLLEKLQFHNITVPGNRPDMIHPHDRSVFDNIFNGFPKSREQGIGYSECRLKTVEGAYGLFGCHYKTLFGKDGAPRMVIGKLVDITGQRIKEKDLVEKTRKDQLTGLYNKAGEEIIERLLKKSEQGFFFMIDLDNFKAVNDTYGHVAGDQVLLQVGTAVNEIFTGDSVAARVGGDEFVVYAPGSADPSFAENKAGAVVRAFQKIKIEQAPGLIITASVGIAACPGDGTDYATLYKAADEAMYEVKRRKKGSFGFYQDADNQKSGL